MKIMHTIYDRVGDMFDYCDDEDHEHYIECNNDTLEVRQWSSARQRQGGPNEVVAIFYSPRRYIRDLLL